MRSIRAAGCVLAFHLATLAILAQAAKPAPGDQDIPITALHPNGSCISLTSRSLQFFDDQEPQSIKAMTPTPQLPIRYVILAQTSKSMKAHGKLVDAAITAAFGFVLQILRPEADLAMFATFDEKYSLVQPLSADIKVLRQAAEKPLAKAGGSAIYDALAETSAYVAKEAKGGSYRLVLILITNAEDNASRLTPEQAFGLATYYGATVYALVVPPPDRLITVTPSTDGKVTIDLDYLKARRFASQTGGLIFYLDEKSNYTQIFNSIRQALLCGYVLRYQPPKIDPSLDPLGVHFLRALIPNDPEALLYLPPAYRPPPQNAADTSAH